MTSELIALKESYENLGMTPAEIADDRGIPVMAVKSALATCSPKYNEDAKLELTNGDGKSGHLAFNDDDEMEANEVIRSTMRHAESEKLRFEAACRIKDEKSGRLDKAKAVGDFMGNLLAFNERLQLMRKQRVNGNAIVDVQAA